MIGYLKGKLLYNDENVIVLDVNGVGYELTVSSACLKNVLENDGGEVYTYTAVKEDDVSLYGFIDREEKKSFLKLITVSGVGPKMAITILSSISLSELYSAIAFEDVKKLSSVKGLGKKTAERIILELKEKIDANGLTKDEREVESALSALETDAINALIGLGFSNTESVSAVKKARNSGADTVEKLIALALRNVK